MNNEKYWEISILCADAEETGAQLFEFGINGVEILSFDRLRCFWKGEEKSLENLRRSIESLGAEIQSSVPVENRNWLKECDELWKEEIVGALTITPVLDDSKATIKSRVDQILIVPGEGFGTGHHASTRAILNYLQIYRASLTPLTTILDLGTGSGILAIAAAKLSNAVVDAIDVDKEALKNALGNVALNEVQRNVRLSNQPFKEFAGPYDLILANLFAEIHLEFERMYYDSLKGGGRIMMAGVRSSSHEEILSAFNSDKWLAERSDEDSGWRSYSFRRK